MDNSDWSVGGILEMDNSDWSNGIQYHIIDTRPDTEFKESAGRRPAGRKVAKMDRIGDLTDQ
jgi:hypothetical protein